MPILPDCLLAISLIDKSGSALASCQLMVSNCSICITVLIKMHFSQEDIGHIVAEAEKFAKVDDASKCKCIEAPNALLLFIYRLKTQLLVAAGFQMMKRPSSQLWGGSRRMVLVQALETLRRNKLADASSR